MKKTKSITLILVPLIVATMTGCNNEFDDIQTITEHVEQDQYDSRSKCEKDWPKEKCTEQRTSNGSYVFFGPTYPYGARPASSSSFISKKQSTVNRTVSVPRGGFGTRAVSSSGG